MIGGRDFEDTPDIDFFLRSNFLIYHKPASAIGTTDDYGLYIPHPHWIIPDADSKKPPHFLFTLDYKYMRLTVAD
jgi:hypothetical protein